MLVAVIIYYLIVLGAFTLLGLLLRRVRCNTFFIWSFLLLGMFYMSVTVWDSILRAMLGDPFYYFLYVRLFLLGSVHAAFIIMYGLFLQQFHTFSWRKVEYFLPLNIGIYLLFVPLEDLGNWIIQGLAGVYSLAEVLQWFVDHFDLWWMWLLGVPAIILAFILSKPSSPHTLVIL